MFLRLTANNKHGQPDRQLIAVADIGRVKKAPASCAPAEACVSLISNPDFPVWSHETVEDIDHALQHLGVEIAPHATKE
ncbi:MAG: hypothetical protein FKY71_08085 [Spiribacter salinus]|uniref:Uncharacterized protein n=1 Tax=Spiribacter salinus TaxID=1335746 RepID=A0A540VRX1_9GAMM|nr:MAG: hypothetical protein FKY71_08085 [Spiribacter salinus]